MPAGVAVPERVAEPAEPPHVLYAGRLSEEKGILEFLDATAGLPRVIVGDGPLRARVPEAVGFVPPSQLGAYFERAAVVCVPSRREGYGFTAREAMAYGRPVVATRVGGLVDLGAGAHLVEPASLHDELARGARRPGAAGAAGGEARATAEAHFSLAASADGLVGRLPARPRLLTSRVLSAPCSP